VGFLISNELVHPESGKACRVASLFTYTTVGDQVQYNFGHISPVLDGSGTTPIETSAGYGGEIDLPDYTVHCAPKQGLTWTTVRDAKDLAITLTRDE
jgi:hypothetical protein